MSLWTGKEKLTHNMTDNLYAFSDGPKTLLWKIGVEGTPLYSKFLLEEAGILRKKDVEVQQRPGHDKDLLSR